ncbi:50S ribosomal protein L24 [Candidatus Uhrbacteria bacterium]|nr:50S ribosomal protein L24 [Candidatus Uhrbacteria bacterium]
MKMKTGDTVRVLAGKDKGKQAKVIQVFPRLEKVVLESLNMAVRHLRSRQKGQPGQKIQFPAPLHVSNVQCVSPKNGTGGRLGSKIIQTDGVPKKVRVLRKRGASEDIA